jgi:hypothetical protein
VDQRIGWFDGTFVEVSSSTMDTYLPDSVYISLGFQAKDINGDTFDRFIASKKQFTEKLMTLRKDQKIRVIGKVAGMGTPKHWIIVERLDIISTSIKQEK